MFLGMIPKLYGSSEHVAHVRTESGGLRSLEHLSVFIDSRRLN